MDGQEKFWLGTWVILGTVVVCFAASAFWYAAEKKRLIGEAIKRGEDPIAVYCAYDSSGPSDNICLTYVATRGLK